MFEDKNDYLDSHSRYSSRNSQNSFLRKKRLSKTAKRQLLLAMKRAEWEKRIRKSHNNCSTSAEFYISSHGRQSSDAITPTNSLHMTTKTKKRKRINFQNIFLKHVAKHQNQAKHHRDEQPNNENISQKEEINIIENFVVLDNSIIDEKIKEESNKIEDEIKEEDEKELTPNTLKSQSLQWKQPSLTNNTRHTRTNVCTHKTNIHVNTCIHRVIQEWYCVISLQTQEQHYHIQAHL